MTALDRIGNRMHIYNARDYSSALAGQDNMILIGSQYSNPWQQLFEARLNFKENPPGVDPGSVINSSPKAGESAIYSPTDSVGYCVVAYLPNPDRGTRALLIEGTSSEATEAGGDFLLSEDEFSGFEKTLHQMECLILKFCSRPHRRGAPRLQLQSWPIAFTNPTLRQDLSRESRPRTS
jgi:hypothetical protein